MSGRPTPRRSRPKAPRVTWTRRAIADLGAIGDYIAADDPLAAERWIGKLLSAGESAARMPLAGRVVPEFGRPDIREVLLDAYRIVHRLLERRIEVLTVFEGHRRLPAGVARAKPRR